MHDLRGKHDKHVVRLTDDVKTLIRQHCDSITHPESHYTREDSELNYFDNPALNLITLYNLFLDYYSAVTGETASPIDKNTYCDYFNYNVNYTFQQPRTDVCNFCEENKMNPKAGTELLEQHLQDIGEYHELKAKMLKDISILYCEFDFAQNLP